MSKDELMIRKKILVAEEKLVEWIEDALDTCVTKNLEESQFRNLLNVAVSTDSPRVIQNFLKYQVGREIKWGRGPNSLAKRIISDIDNKIKSEAETIALSIRKENPPDFHPIWLQLIRRYLGYGSRYLVYINSEASN